MESGSSLVLSPESNRELTSCVASSLNLAFSGLPEDVVAGKEFLLFGGQLHWWDFPALSGCFRGPGSGVGEDLVPSCLGSMSKNSVSLVGWLPLFLRLAIPDLGSPGLCSSDSLYRGGN